MRFAIPTWASILVVAVLFVLTHMGAYPWLLNTGFFRLLSIFVALNTIGFALIATVKLGYRSGRASASGVRGHLSPLVWGAPAEGIAVPAPGPQTPPNAEGRP